MKYREKKNVNCIFHAHSWRILDKDSALPIERKWLDYCGILRNPAGAIICPTSAKLCKACVWGRRGRVVLGGGGW